MFNGVLCYINDDNMEKLKKSSNYLLRDSGLIVIREPCLQRMWDERKIGPGKEFYRKWEEYEKHLDNWGFIYVARDYIRMY